MRTDHLRCSQRREAGGQPIVHQHDRPIGQLRQRIASGIRAGTTPHFFDGLPDDTLDGLRIQREGAHDMLVELHRTVHGHGAEAHLG